MLKSRHEWQSKCLVEGNGEWSGVESKGSPVSQAASQSLLLETRNVEGKGKVQKGWVDQLSSTSS